jgi:hypothetical protein
MKVALRLGFVAALVLGLAAGAVAQNPPPAQPAAPLPPGQMRLRMMRQQAPNPDQAAMIRAQIEERFGQAIKNRLGLSDQQMERLRTVSRANEDRHRDYGQREADMFRAVMDQMKPGVAANQDSVGRLLEGIAALRVQRAQSDQQELRELAQFLNPLQRAQLLVMRQQMMNRVEAIRRGGQGGMGMGGGQGMGPGMGGPGIGPGMGQGAGPGMMQPGQVRRPRMPRDSQPEF